jgi:hypothetical protein
MQDLIIRLTSAEENANLIKSISKAKADHLQQLEKQVVSLGRRAAVLERAVAVVKEVQNRTQNHFRSTFESAITACLATVFDRPSECKIEFNPGSGSKYSTATVFIQEGDNIYDPKDDDGGSLLDMLSAGMRWILWSIDPNRKRNFFLHDEPIKFVGRGEDLLKGAEALREMSKEFNLQLIILTHDEEVASIADKKWRFHHDGQTTRAEEVTNRSQRHRRWSGDSEGVD